MTYEYILLVLVMLAYVGVAWLERPIFEYLDCLFARWL